MNTNHTILIAGFIGKNNSTNILLNHLKDANNIDLLYLKNSFITSENQIKNQLSQNYQSVLIFGQKPRTKNFYLETAAHQNGHKITTSFNYSAFKPFLEQTGHQVLSSDNAGRYLCNHVFYQALTLKETNHLSSKIALIHIPSIKNLTNLTTLTNALLDYIKSID